ncbi:SMC-Scp complex subunit ScpB [Glaciecola sp. 2405UD65-10]|uniref:SMC-Scp complex subunit ScpB n=1 Tax=Glaciecola sp. 2405UD65-10 TaxID=3397244 RepID=UPI003B594A49
MSKISDQQLKQLIEAAIFVSEKPLSVERMRNTILAELAVSVRQLNKALKEIELDYAPRGINLVKVASGYRFQSVSGLGQILSKLWQETVPKYSRAMLETLALIAYKQPITRGEIEEVRGVAVSSNIIRSLSERNWIKVVGNKEVPGRPALFATTATFLDYFSLTSLSELPSAEEFAANIEAALDATNSPEVTLELDQTQGDLLPANKANIH